MPGRVHLFCAGGAASLPCMPAVVWLLLASQSLAQYPPPGLVAWGRQTYLLEPRESVSFEVTFAEIPVRRWVLLVETDGRPADLNLRRVRDGGLVHDQKDEARHLVEIPWGEGEALSAVLMAGDLGGACAVSIWGPPADAYLRAYGYEVNRALEALAAQDLDRAREHLLTALRDDPDDLVAATLLRAASAGITPSAGPPPHRDARSPRVADLREAARRHLAVAEPYAALDSLQSALAAPAPPWQLVEVYADLVGVHLALRNPIQARAAAAAAEALGLATARVDSLQEQISSLADPSRMRTDR